MALDSTAGSSTAESYASVAEADLYHANRGNAAWAALSNPEKEQALRRATDYLLTTYKRNWKGYRTSTTQALDWPRMNVLLEDNGLPIYFPQDIVPLEVRKAASELALKSTTEELNPDLDREVLSESVGSLSVTYAPGGRQKKAYSNVEQLLRPFFRNPQASLAISRA